MATAHFKAAALTSEIGLDAIATHFGSHRKFRWEDSLTLGAKALQGVVSDPDGKVVHIFSFGSIVFVNCQHHEIMDIIRYLGQVEKNLAGITRLDYIDDYRIESDADAEPAVHHDFLVTPAEQNYHREIVATILAKSVALERTEIATDALKYDEGRAASWGDGRDPCSFPIPSRIRNTSARK